MADDPQRERPMGTDKLGGGGEMSIRLTTRNDFSPVYVMSLVQNDDLPADEWRRILEEACHRIVKLEQEIRKYTTM